MELGEGLEVMNDVPDRPDILGPTPEDDPQGGGGHRQPVGKLVTGCGHGPPHGQEELIDQN
jgi:hypothetical protein